MPEDAGGRGMSSQTPIWSMNSISDCRAAWTLAGSRLRPGRSSRIVDALLEGVLADCCQRGFSAGVQEERDALLG
eukprot:5453937-Lingulodinium_polyedra.AAC.1